MLRRRVRRARRAAVSAGDELDCRDRRLTSRMGRELEALAATNHLEIVLEGSILGGGIPAARRRARHGNDARH